MFLALDEQTFDIHPYFQITGQSAYSNGMAGAGGTTYFGSPPSDKNAGALAVALHSLPPFGIEYGRSLDLFLPKGISIGYDYFYIPQTAAGVAKSGTVLPIASDTYLYNFSGRLYAFDPAKPGLNYYFGLGMGVLEGTLTAQPFVGQEPQYINYTDTQIGFTVLGLEAKGNHWGARYELWVINAANVKLASNPYPAPSSGTTTLDFSGSIVRIALFYQF